MSNLRLKQYDSYLAKFALVKTLPSPAKGWVKYVRNALGMTAKQLGARAGLSRQRIVDIERAELDGATTLKTLNQIAAALDCKLVYAIVPRTSVRQTLEEQAKRYVKQHLSDVQHNMALEEQGVDEHKAIDAQIEDLVNQYLAKSTKKIWDI